MNLEFVRPLLKFIPEITLPKRHIAFKEKVFWSVVILALFFIMGNVRPIGVSIVDLPQAYQSFQMIFASNTGSIISVGIGPIVTASIVLQLLVGSKMLDIDLSTNDGKALFQGTQKILTVLIALFEGAAIVIGFKLGSQLLGAAWAPTHPVVIGAILQIALGSIILMYLDEIVSKWGIGSGIGLFIAAGVALHIISGSFNFLTLLDPERFPNLLGYIPQFILGVFGGNLDLILLFPVLATIVVFLVAVFAESMRIEIPLSYGGVRGVGGRYPIRFFYVSNIPVILAAALLANVQMLPALVGVNLQSPQSEMSPIQNAVLTFTEYVTTRGAGHSLDGILDPRNFKQLFNYDILMEPAKWFDYAAFSDFGILTHSLEWCKIISLPIFIHLIIYLIVFLLLCVLFGKFWVETTGLSADKVAEQIQSGGMQIPGFRRDKRVVERVLNRYIPQITIISSIAVGLLAVGADLLGAMGTGTGILLTVGILYRLYEEIEKQQMAEVNPMLRKFMGKS
jgi:preprotein translocase subunit SecY